MIQTSAEVLEEAILGAMVKGAVRLGKFMVKGLIELSYPVCLGVALIATFLYIGGQKKAGKYISMSTVIFAVLQALKLFINLDD